MKKPRTEAFDTSTNPKPLKSPLDNMPSIEMPSKEIPKQTGATSPVPPVRDVLPVQGARRKIKSRHPFDIYEDQLDTLKQLSLEDRMRGGAGSMSAMVREALDDYFAKIRNS